jgi:hypothetical protein
MHWKPRWKPVQLEELKGNFKSRQKRTHAGTNTEGLQFIEAWCNRQKKAVNMIPIQPVRDCFFCNEKQREQATGNRRRRRR